ncbi:hypothetical protein RZS08_26555, partial [Arthrospira platensis SPKY1]|nr:hypothetical protein [Arthrospira platensis SPKY1]
MTFTKNSACLFFLLLLSLVFYLPPMEVAAENSVSKNCSDDAIKTSICIFQAILQDVDKNYPLRGGGGIARIVQDSTTSYSVYLLQEGRVDVRTYEIGFTPKGEVAISSIKERVV